MDENLMWSTPVRLRSGAAVAYSQIVTEGLTTDTLLYVNGQVRQLINTSGLSRERDTSLPISLSLLVL